MDSSIDPLRLGARGPPKMAGPDATPLSDLVIELVATTSKEDWHKPAKAVLRPATGPAAWLARWRLSSRMRGLVLLNLVSPAGLRRWP